MYTLGPKISYGPTSVEFGGKSYKWTPETQGKIDRYLEQIKESDRIKGEAIDTLARELEQ